jgi:WD40 repeat protein
LRARQLLEDAQHCPEEFRDFTWRLYRRDCQRDWATLGGGIGPLKDAVYSTQHRLVVSAGVDGCIRLWNVDTGEEVDRHFAHSDVVSSLDLSPDGKLAASASRDGTVRLWTIDVADGKPKLIEQRVLGGNYGAVMDAVFSPDGRTIATAGIDATARLWDATTGAELAALKRREQEADWTIHSLAFSPNGQYLAAGAENREVWVWSQGDPIAVRALPAVGMKSILRVAFAPHESTLAVGHQLGIGLWDWERPDQLALLPGHHGKDISGMQVLADGERLVTTGFDGCLRIWDIRSRAQTACFTGHKDRISSLDCSRTGNVATTASYDGTIKLWNLRTNPAEQSIAAGPGAVNAVAFAPGKRTFVTVGADGVRLWDAEQGIELGRFSGHTGPVEGALFSPNGSMLATAGSDGTVRLWDPQTFREVATLRRHDDRVGVLAFSPDGRKLASGGRDKLVWIWDVDSHKPLRKLTGHTDKIWALAFSPDGRQLLSGGRDGTLRFWNSETGNLEDLARDPEGQGIGSCLFSPDGRTLATATSRLSEVGEHLGTIYLWDAATRQIRQVLRGHTDEVFCVAFSPDGRTLASSSRDRVVRLWDACTGQERASLTGHKDWVYCVAFSDDGAYLASAGLDGEIKLWNGSELRLPEPTVEIDSPEILSFKTLVGHTEFIDELVIGANGRLLASASKDQTLRIWDLLTGECRHVIRSEESRFNSVRFDPDGKSILVWDKLGRVQRLDLESGIRRADVASAPGGAYGTLSGDGRLVAINRPTKNWQLGPLSLWDLETEQPRWEVSARVRGAPLFTRDDDLLVTSDVTNEHSGVIRFRSVANGKPVSELDRYWGQILGYCLTPDEKELVLVGSDPDRPIEVWRVDSKQRRLTLRGHTDVVKAAAISPDGRLLATGSGDQTIRLWALQSGEPLAVLRGHIGPVECVKFTPDGQTIVSAGNDHLIKLWAVPAVLQ